MVNKLRKILTGILGLGLLATLYVGDVESGLIYKRNPRVFQKLDLVSDIYRYFDYDGINYEIDVSTTINSSAGATFKSLITDDFRMTTDPVDGYVMVTDSEGDGTWQFIGSTILLPDSVTLVNGSLVSGDVDSLKEYDGVFYIIQEVGGIEAFEFIVDFTDIEDFAQIVTREEYAGSTSHHVKVQLWEWGVSDWEDYFEFAGQDGQNVSTIAVFDPEEHIGTGGDLGRVRLRVVHEQSGIGSHQILTDIVWLIDGDFVGSSTDLTGYAKYGFMFNDFDGNGDFDTTGNISASSMTVTYGISASTGTFDEITASTFTAATNEHLTIQGGLNRSVYFVPSTNNSVMFRNSTNTDNKFGYVEFFDSMFGYVNLDMEDNDIIDVNNVNSNYVNSSSMTVTYGISAGSITISDTGSFGDVGIGTTEPRALLEINGGGTTALWVIGDTDTRIVIGDTTSGSDYGELRWDTSNNYLGLDADDTQHLVLQEDGGNVGIGTVGPVYKLDVQGGAIQQQGSADINGYLLTNSGDLLSTTNLNPGILVFHGTANSNYGMDLGYNSGTSKYRTRIFTNNTQDIAFGKLSSPAEAQSDFTEWMTIEAGGNVGIGTTDPQVALDVVGAIAASSTTVTYGISAGSITITENLTIGGTIYMDNNDIVNVNNINGDTNTQVITDLNPILHYTFNRVITDNEGNHDLQQDGGTTQYSDRGASGVLKGDGASGWVVNDGYKGVLGDNPRTLIFWFMTTPSAERETILNYGGAQSWTIRYDPISAPINAGKFSIFTGEGNRQTGDISATVEDGEWHPYAFVVPDKVSPQMEDQLIYVDGVDVASAFAGTDIDTDSGVDVHFGIDSIGLNHLAGNLQHMALFDRELSSSEINEIITAQKDRIIRGSSNSQINWTDAGSDFKTSGSISAGNGFTGSFEDFDENTVTVVGGIIISVD